MPTSSLNQSECGWQMTSSGAWQQWIGLPEGASLKFRLDNLADPSNLFRTIKTEPFSSMFAPASPRAGSEHVLARSRSASVTALACGHLEDGVPHAEALSPANTPPPIIGPYWAMRTNAQCTVVVFALATTPQISSM